MTTRNDIAIDIYNNEIAPNIPRHAAAVMLVAEVKSLLTNALTNDPALLENEYLTMCDILISYLVDCFDRDDRIKAVKAYELWSYRIREEMDE